MRWQKAARGQFPPGGFASACAAHASSSASRSRSCCGSTRRYGPVFSMRLMSRPVVFALGPEANHYMTVSGASNFRWRDGGIGDLIPLLGDGLLTTDGDYHRRARRIMLTAFHRQQIAAATATDGGGGPSKHSSPGATATRLDLYAWTRRLALRIAMRALFGFDPAHGPEMAQQFERALRYWGRSYAAQMLHGPGSPYRAMVRAREWLDAVIFDEIERRFESGERGSRTSSACSSTRRTRTAPGSRSRSCVTR